MPSRPPCRRAWRCRKATRSPGTAAAARALAGAVIAGSGAGPVLLPPLAVVCAGSAGAMILLRHPILLAAGLDWTEAHAGPAGRALVRITGGFRQAARSLT